MSKRYLMECIGTFFLTIAISFIGNPLAIGFVLMAMIYIGGHISGAHFNPAISFACFIQNRLSISEMIMYVLAQSVGALLGLFIFSMIMDISFGLDIIPGNPMVGATFIEGLLTLLLCWVYLSLNFAHRYDNSAIAGCVMGLTLMAIAFLPGGLFNPAVALAAIICGIIKDGSGLEIATLVIYIVGPLLGGLGSSLLFNYFKPYDLVVKKEQERIL